VTRAAPHATAAARAPHWLIAGASVRAFAESATAAGITVTAVDAYGDLDLRACAASVVVPVVASSRAGASAATAAAVVAARSLDVDAVAYTSGFENHPRAVAALADRRTLLGNPPAVLDAVRDPFALARALAGRAPAVRASAPPPGDVRRWLRKPRASGGGHGITPWHPGTRVPRSTILQQRIPGTPGSIVFAADGESIWALGLTRQLIGDPAFGAHGFRYCGTLLLDATALPTLTAQAIALAADITRAFGLLGVNGVDFVAHDRRAVPIEVNPRYTAAMELVERAHATSIAAVHAATARRQRPVGDAPIGHRARRVVGKAIVYARRAVTAGDTTRWLDDETVRDIPIPGTRIDRGRPICTVFAEARDAGTCHARLVARAARIYAALAPARRAA